MLLLPLLPLEYCSCCVRHPSASSHEQFLKLIGSTYRPSQERLEAAVDRTCDERWCARWLTNVVLGDSERVGHTATGAYKIQGESAVVAWRNGDQR